MPLRGRGVREPRVISVISSDNELCAAEDLSSRLSVSDSHPTLRSSFVPGTFELLFSFLNRLAATNTFLLVWPTSAIT